MPDLLGELCGCSNKMSALDMSACILRSSFFPCFKVIQRLQIHGTLACFKKPPQLWCTWFEPYVQREGKKKDLKTVRQHTQLVVALWSQRLLSRGCVFFFFFPPLHFLVHARDLLLVTNYLPTSSQITWRWISRIVMAFLWRIQTKGQLIHRPFIKFTADLIQLVWTRAKLLSIPQTYCNNIGQRSAFSCVDVEWVPYSRVLNWRVGEQKWVTWRLNVVIEVASICDCGSF